MRKNLRRKEGLRQDGKSRGRQKLVIGELIAEEREYVHPQRRSSSQLAAGGKKSRQFSGISMPGMKWKRKRQKKLDSSRRRGVYSGSRSASPEAKSSEGHVWKNVVVEKRNRTAKSMPPDGPRLKVSSGSTETSKKRLNQVGQLQKRKKHAETARGVAVESQCRGAVRIGQGKYHGNAGYRTRAGKRTCRRLPDSFRREMD